MTSKDFRRYELVVQIGNTQPTEDIVQLLEELARNDFQTALEVWEFMLIKHSALLSQREVSRILESRLFEIFSKISDSRLRTALGGETQLLRHIYTYSATSADQGSANLAYLTSLILASKIDVADEILKLVATNKTPDFGTRMQTIIDDVFTNQCKKSNTRVPSLNKKQIMLLLEYALKIKGPNKAILTQRIKELS